MHRGPTNRSNPGCCRITQTLQHRYRNTGANQSWEKPTPIRRSGRHAGCSRSSPASGRALSRDLDQQRRPSRRPRSLRKNLQSLGGPLPHTDNENWLDAVHIAGISAADFGRAQQPSSGLARMPGSTTAKFARRGAGADIIASGATKIAGSLNFKDKYAPEFSACEDPRSAARAHDQHRRARAYEPGRAGRNLRAKCARSGLIGPIRPRSQACGA